MTRLEAEILTLICAHQDDDSNVDLVNRLTGLIEQRMKNAAHDRTAEFCRRLKSFDNAKGLSLPEVADALWEQYKTE